MTGPATVADLGERDIIRRIRARAGGPPAWVHVAIGDDAAVVAGAPRRLDVLTTDAQVEGVHFDLGLMSAADAGARALAVNLSDLAAMGAEPRLVLLSLGLPASMSVPNLDGLIEGVMSVATAHRVAVVGGNVTRTTGPLFIDVTATGTVHPRKVLRRDGARPGDEVYVSGSVGGAAAGLAWLRGLPPGDAASGTVPGDDAWVDAVARYRRPVPRVRLGLLVGRTGAASSCMDLSDGLGDAVAQVAEASGVGAVIDADVVPLHVAASRGPHAGDVIAWAIGAGDDYELLFTVSKRRRRAFHAAVRRAGVAMTRIGEVTRERGVRLRRHGSDEPLPGGYAHFA